MWLDDLGLDLRYAVRTLRRAPGFAFIVILTLALGIGANTAIFSVVHGVLLKPLPYPHADQLVTLSAIVPASETRPYAAEMNTRVTVAELTTIQSRTRTVSEMTLNGYPALMTMVGRGETTRVEGITV